MYAESGCGDFGPPLVQQSAYHYGCRVFASGEFPCVRAHLGSLIVISTKLHFDLLNDLLTTDHRVRYDGRAYWGMPCTYLRLEDYPVTTCL